jgi:putative membrane protein
MDGMCPMCGALVGTWGAGWGIGMMLVPLFFGVLIIAGLGAGVWWLARQGFAELPRRGGPGLPRPSDPAAEILRERFARGEIDREEFEERRRLLSG